MRILSVSAQKPHSTGSGVYLTELVKGFHELGHEQAVLAGVYKDDTVELPPHVNWFPVYFQTEELSFPIAGMSDEMPYESTLYSQMTEQMQKQFIHIFELKLKEAIEKFQPELILCHHLYLLAAIARRLFPDRIVIGVCHGSDVRQIQKNQMQRAFIKEEVKHLNLILALHEEQKEEIAQLYECEKSRIMVIGTGYNQHIFNRSEVTLERERQEDKVIRIIYAGKLSEKKGVMSLIRSLAYLPFANEDLILYLAGGYGNETEFQKIQSLADTVKYKIKFLGRLSQPNLAERFRQSDVFVLASFFEGLPLVIIEALACGLKVVTTELPGIRLWMDRNITGNGIKYVSPPKMENTDEPIPAELPGFEKRLAEAIALAAADQNRSKPELEHISWNGICKSVLSQINSNRICQ